MANITIKIVGVENDSVLVKYVSEKSLKRIEQYDAVAYQPRLMGYNTLEEFIQGIKPSLLNMVEARDATEQTKVDLKAWKNYETTVIVNPADMVPIIPPATEAQLINDGSEVIL